MKLKEAVMQHMVDHLLNLCQKELELKQLPPIDLINQPFIEGGKKRSFGEFDGKSIRVVTKDRHPVDVMRTLAHEVVHWKQRVSGMPMDGSDGSHIENQANAVAGTIMRKFAEMYPDYFINSLPH